MGCFARLLRCNESIPMVELRKASIHLLLSALCLPLHFKSLPIKGQFLVNPFITIEYYSY